MKKGVHELANRSQRADFFSGGGTRPNGLSSPIAYSRMQATA